MKAPIVEHYDLAVRQGHVEVAFPCDGLGDRIDEIVVEMGSGHGGSLDVWRARRRSDGRFDVRGLGFQGASMMHAPIGIHPVAAVVSLPDLDVARAGVTATVKEVDPPLDGGFEFSGTSSSNDFHALVRLVDSEGRVVERRYTGYAGSDGQDVFRPLSVAQQALQPIINVVFDPEAPAAAPLAVSDVDRELFADRFVAAVPHFDEPFYWWVMERFVAMARSIGTPRVIPGLVTRMTFADKDRSHVDARKNALDAIAEITGWNARQGGLSDEAAGKLVAADCR